MKYKWKYVHIIYAKDGKFSKKLLEMFHNPEFGFNMDEHLFVTDNQRTYDESGRYTNFLLDTKPGNLYVRYAKQAKWIISHSMAPRKHVFLTSKHILKRVIFRYWGGFRFTHYTYPKNDLIGNIKKRIKVEASKYFLNSFAAIGIANYTDILDLQSFVNHKKYYYLGYSYGVELSSYITPGSKTSDGFIHVLLGHRGTEENNHIEVLKKLSQYNDKKLKIYIPISYGDTQYIDNLKQYVKSNHFDNVIFLEEFLPYEEYVRLLNNIDIAIFDGYTSYALGNISVLLYFGKTIYLNKDGVIRKAFDKDHVKWHSIDLIGSVPYEEFCSINENIGIETDLKARSPSKTIELWKAFLSDYQ